MKELFTLGELYVSDFIKPDDEPKNDKVEMKLLLDDNGAVRLEKSAPLNTMYGKYWYRSGINATMKTELQDIVQSIVKIFKPKQDDLWVDIACNDGTLLGFVPPMKKIGIDPADDSFKAESEKHADYIIQDFFSSKAFKESKFGNLKAKIITSIAMFYDLENPDDFIKNIDEVLDDNGLWVLQLSYTPLMIKQMAFDNICFKPDTRIMGANKPISSIEPGEMVLDRYGKYTKVAKRFDRKYDGDLIDIKAQYLENIECTPEHPILVVREGNIQNKKTEWVDAKDIKVNDFLVVPKIATKDINRKIDLKDFNKTNDPHYRRGLQNIELTDDVLWMMGLYVAEGHISGKETNLQINFTLNVNEQEYASKLKSTFKNIGYKASIRNSKVSQAMNVQVSCTALARAFKCWFGKGAINKKIPDFIFTSKSDVAKPFLNGLIDGDGSVDNQVSFHSSSKTLIHQVQLMLATLNAMTGLSYVKPYDREIKGGTVHSKDSWQLRGKNKYLDEIFNAKATNKRLSTQYFFDENNVYVSVKNVSKKHYNGSVHNIETDNHTYVVSNAVVHNCHEHMYYYSLFNLKSLFERNGFKIVDCQLNDVNGGSFRIYAMKQNSNEKLFGSQPHRDICNMRIDSLLKYEESLKLNKASTWRNFFQNIKALKKQTVSFIKQAKSEGKSVWAYGASTKGNTLLQYFGLDHTLIDGIAERSPYKFGLKTVGTNIPIFSEEEMRQVKPDYLLVLPWHFINEFIEREKDYLNNGGAFIVPCPKFEIIKM